LIVGLGGGIGASRLWRALAGAVGEPALTLVVNTADDLWIHGLRVCPDLDTTLYSLSGRQDRTRGWGLRDETFRAMDELRGLGEEVWLSLGDRDLATHLLRTGLLREGTRLAAVTGRLARAMGVRARVLPMTEDEVATTVEIDGAELHYEDFLVRHRARPVVRRVHYAGCPAARPGPGVLEAIGAAELVVLAPSNPVASIEPILAIAGIADALRCARAPIVAVTPIVSALPIADPGERHRALSRAILLQATGSPATATAVAARYRDLAERFVLDAADSDEAGAIRELGLEVTVASTLVHLGASPTELARAVLDS
jgi:LPPG:FO 2-phospho-L-lactate transferase